MSTAVTASRPSCRARAACSRSVSIEAWAARLDSLGVGHSPLIEASVGWLLAFDDPDGLQLHLYSWAAHGNDHSDRSGYGRPLQADQHG